MPKDKNGQSAERKQEFYEELYADAYNKSGTRDRYDYETKKKAWASLIKKELGVSRCRDSLYLKVDSIDILNKLQTQIENINQLDVKNAAQFTAKQHFVKKLTAFHDETRMDIIKQLEDLELHLGVRSSGYYFSETCPLL